MKVKGLHLNKAVTTLISINFIQILLLVGIGVYSRCKFKESLFNIKNKDLKLLLIVVLFIIFTNIIMAIRNIRELTNANSRYNMASESLKRVENLNNILRAQRHDFLNHLQVVHTLLELDEYDEAKDYIEKVYEDIKKVSRVLKTSQPAINALLQAKLADCEMKGVKVNLNITSQLKQLKVPSWEMCRVLGNLIDNAIYELQKVHHDDRLLEIKIFEQLNNYILIVRNNASEIPKEIQQNIFEPAFTTKGEEGQGMGLYITKEIVQSNGGSITVYSDENYTEFKVTV